MYAPIERRKVYELIAEQLLAQIGDRRLRPGDTLPPERELTKLYGVGRSSVREALRMLESKGLIHPAASGTFSVAEFRQPLNDSLSLLLQLSEATTSEIYELRRVLECEAAALAAQRTTAEHVRRMRAEIGEMERCLGDADGYIDADLRFHLAVAEAAGNRLLLHSMHAVRDLLRRTLRSIFRIPASPEASLPEHRSIVEAIEAGDADAARDAMRSHLTRVETDVHGVAAGPAATVGR